MLLLVAGAAALVPPGSRPSGAVACRGAAYDYCVQALGCTAAEATKAEGVLLPNIAESMTRTQAEEKCGWLRSAVTFATGGRANEQAREVLADTALHVLLVLLDLFQEAFEGFHQYARRLTEHVD